MDHDTVALGSAVASLAGFFGKPVNDSVLAFEIGEPGVFYGWCLHI
jgi:hypothetical protein